LTALFKVIFYLFTLVVCVGAEVETVTIAQMLAEPQRYLSSVSRVLVTSSNGVMLEGEKKRKLFITGDIVSSIVQSVNKGEGFPECFIDHTEEERQSYIDFSNEFKHRPLGSDGGLLVMKWHRKKIMQRVIIKNAERNSELASVLFQSDVYLKKMVMEKKGMHVSGMPSFVRYVESKLYDRIEENCYAPGYRSESVFVLTPDTIQITALSDTMWCVDRMKFKMVPYQQYRGNDAGTFETEWAERFNKNYDKILKKHTQLQQLTEVFKMYYALNNNRVAENLSVGTRAENGTSIPEEIGAEKFSRCIEVPVPITTQPARIRFQWIMISGGITFDYSNAIIIRK